jgi:hypothetical protein
MNIKKPPLFEKWPKKLGHDFRSPNLYFWLAFLLLNAIYFLPFYLFNHSDRRFFPLPGVDLHAIYDLFISREHFDLLRVNAEITLALAFWANLAGRWRSKERAWFWRIFYIFYVVALVYETYAGVLVGLYQMQPNFYNDYSFILRGIPFLLESLDFPGWYYPAFGLGLISLVSLLWKSTRALLVDFPVTKLGRGTRGVLAGIAVLVLAYGWTYRSDLSNPQMIVTSLSA